jgi:integrase
MPIHARNRRPYSQGKAKEPAPPNRRDCSVIQAIMRHASAAFALAVYDHRDRSRMAAAVANLPELKPATGSAPEQHNAAAGA